MELLFGRGSKKPIIMFIADCPTIQEYQAKKLMIGQAGMLMKKALKTAKIDIADCYFTSYVKYAMEEDDMKPTKQDIEYCQEYIEAEIELKNPKIIVPLGDIALKKLYGKTGMTKHRGKAVVKEDKIIFPILHPNVLFNQPKHSGKWITDLETLKELVEKGDDYFERKGVDYRYLETIEEVEKELRRLFHAKWLCFDLETTGLDAFQEDSKIVCISLTDRTHYGVTIPLEHNDFHWKGVELDRIKVMLKALLENKKIKKMAYNGKFDTKWLKYLYDIDVKSFKFDPMLAHYLCISEERGGHSLKNLSWEYTDMGGYEAELDEYKETLPTDIRNNYYYIKWEILREYASADVDCTFRLFEIFYDMVKKNKKWDYVFNNILMKGSDMLKDLEINGAYIDLERLKMYEEEYPKRIEAIEKELRSYPEVVMIEREKMDLFVQRQLEMKKPKDQRDPEILKYQKYKDFKFNFGSSPNLRELLFVKLGLETPFLTKKGEERKRRAEKKKQKFEPTLEELSTGKETLSYLADKHPITKLLSEWRRLEKVYGTYVAPARSWLGADGVAHSTYLQHGTVTGRLACENPNAQNFPRKCNNPSDFEYEFGIKKMFTSRFKEEGIMLQFDYSQLELRVAVMFSNDKGLQEAYQNGLDIHRYSSSKALKIPYDEVTSDERTSAKAINFGLLYGKGIHALARDMKDGTPEKAQEFMDNYFKEFPDVKKWLDDTKEKVKKDKYVESLLGRYRRLEGVDSTNKSIVSDCMRQSVNAPIQSTGSDITVMSMILINEQFKRLGLKTKIAISVHDSIVVDCYLPELETVWDIMKYTMEHPPFDFINVPLVADAEIGRSYGDLVEIGSLDELKEFKDVFDYCDTKHHEKYLKDLENERKRS